MKVYVEKIPKECYCCVFNIEDTGGIGGYCIFGGCKKTCPLQSLADHDKQVRKEVCEEIKDFVSVQLITRGDLGYYDIERFLDQIQGE